MVATGAELRARRSEVVNRHVDAENRHDPDGVVASVNRPRYGIPRFGEAGQANGADAVRELWPGSSPGPPTFTSTRAAPARR